MSFAKQTSGSGSSSSSAFVPAADAVMAQLAGASSAAPDLAPSANANASANGTLAAAAAPFAGMY